MTVDAAAYREAESALWASLGITPDEQLLDLPRGGQVRAVMVGEGDPLVFVHGVSNAGASWAPLVAALDGFRCIVIDRPGCGLSPVWPTPVTELHAFETFADGFVVGVLDALELDRAGVVATSFGGYLAFHAAAAHPDRVTALAEIGWTVGAPVGKLPLVMRVAAIRSIGRLMTSIPPTKSAVRALLRQIGLRQALESGRVTDVIVEWFLSMLRDTDTMRNELDAGPQLIAPVRGLDSGLLLSPELLSRVTAEVGLLWGAEDPFGGPDIARAFAAHLPTARLEIVPRAGHAPWLDDTAGTAAFVTSVLRP